jgi:bacterioferritin (cytochrome b1)
MARSSRSYAIKAIANQRVEDAVWGAPESPEFSAVQHLMNEFKSHENDEAKHLRTYQEIAAQSEDPLAHFLLGLIIADEERHQQIVGRMVARLEKDLAWKPSEGTARKIRPSAAKVVRLQAALERFLAVERSGIKDYERLRQASGGVGHDIFELLCRTMVYDSEKHIDILEFLLRRLRQARKTAKPRG